MTGADVWDTPDKIQTEMDRLLEGLPGWERPVAHGVVLVDDPPGEIRFPVVNVEAHYFPAVVMSVVTGRVAGTGDLRDIPW